MHKADALHLVLGNKNYSSWSLRAYLVARQTGAPIREEVVPLDQPDTKARVRAHSPSGLVPFLGHRGAGVWDSLAIAEYLAEVFPGAGLWPSDSPARARARAVSAEMHSGFASLRASMPMNMRADLRGRGRAPGVLDNIARISELWRDCRAQFGAGGPFLFGAFTIADAMYAPVVSRFRTYAVELDEVCEAYAEAIWAHPPFAEWLAAARAEPWSMHYDAV